MVFLYSFDHALLAFRAFGHRKLKTLRMFKVALPPRWPTESKRSRLVTFPIIKDIVAGWILAHVQDRVYLRKPTFASSWGIRGDKVKVNLRAGEGAIFCRFWLTWPLTATNVLQLLRLPLPSPSGQEAIVYSPKGQTNIRRFSCDFYR